MVELNDPSDETLEQYIKKGFVPLIKSIDTSNSEKIKEGLEALNKNEKAVINVRIFQHIFWKQNYNYIL